MELDRLALDQNGLEGLDAEAVQRRSAVEQHRVLADDFIENVPDLRPLLLDHFIRALDPGHIALYAAQTSGWSWIALPSIRMGSKAWMPRRCSVGARLSSTGCSRMTSSRMSQTSGRSFW